MIVDVINGVSFASFWVLLFVGTGSTLARVAYYRRNGYRQPKLLTRDAVMVAGFSMSFGLILVARFARAAGYDISGLATSPGWALLTSIPAIVAVATYAAFEIFVIERGQDHIRDEAYHLPPDEDEAA